MFRSIPLQATQVNFAGFFEIFMYRYNCCLGQFLALGAKVILSFFKYNLLGTLLTYFGRCLPTLMG
jgi:hypothetical protein